MFAVFRQEGDERAEIRARKSSFDFSITRSTAHIRGENWHTYKHCGIALQQHRAPMVVVDHKTFTKRARIETVLPK